MLDTIRYRLWWCVHNGVAHPLMMLWWWAWPLQFHDWTFARLQSYTNPQDGDP